MLATTDAELGEQIVAQHASHMEACRQHESNVRALGVTFKRIRAGRTPAQFDAWCREHAPGVPAIGYIQAADTSDRELHRRHLNSLCLPLE